jgi:hypothetical protein
MATFLAVVVLTTAPIALAGLALWHLRHRGVALACAYLLGAAVLVAACFVAQPLAEARNDWVDRDHDGMLDGFANGSYDWVDVNGGTWLRTWGALDATLLVVAGLTVAAVRGLRHQEG